MRWFATGGTGQLGGHVCALLAERGEGVAALVGRDGKAPAGTQPASGNLLDPEGLQAAIRRYRPAFVLHIAAMTAVSDAFADPAGAERANVTATAAIVEASAEVGARVVFTSTDMVFDGSAAPYAEDASPAPLSVYGRTKAAAERVVLAYERGVVARVPLMYGFPLTDRPVTFVQQIKAVRDGAPLRLFVDEYRTPVWLRDAARALIGLAESDYAGLMHVSGPQRLSRLELVQKAAELLGLQGTWVPISRKDVPAPEPRPEDLSLVGSRLEKLFPELVPGPLRAEVFR
jgi:dTDP-4-dehydrorhamnose reductase